MCGICGLPVAWAEYALDHIRPDYLGGTDDETNLQAAHRSCNNRKNRFEAPRRPT